MFFALLTSLIYRQRAGTPADNKYCVFGHLGPGMRHGSGLAPRHHGHGHGIHLYCGDPPGDVETVLRIYKYLAVAECLLYVYYGIQWCLGPADVQISQSRGHSLNELIKSHSLKSTVQNSQFLDGPEHPDSSRIQFHFFKSEIFQISGCVRD